MATATLTKLQNFINGELVDPADGATEEVVTPATGEPIAEAPLSTEEDVDRAVKAARSAFDEWSTRPPMERSAALLKIVAAIGEGLMALNREGRVVFTNERVGQMFGFDDTMAGRPYLEIVRKQPLVEAFQLAMRGEESTRRVSAQTDRGERQIEIRVFPVPSNDIAAVALFIDITEIERLQQMKKDFLDDFSHEVRTPLAGLQSAAESFDGHLTADQEKQLRAIMFRQLDRIRRLVSDLAELNHIESGGLVLEKRDVDLLALREWVATFLVFVRLFDRAVGLVPRLEPRELERGLRLLGEVPDDAILRLVKLLDGLPDDDVLNLVEALSHLSPTAARRATKLMSGVIRTVGR